MTPVQTRWVPGGIGATKLTPCGHDADYPSHLRVRENVLRRGILRKTKRDLGVRPLRRLGLALLSRWSRSFYLYSRHGRA